MVDQCLRKKVKSAVHVVQKNDAADLQNEMVAEEEPVLTEGFLKKHEVADLQNNMVAEEEPVLTEEVQNPVQRNGDVAVIVSGPVIPSVRLHKCGGAFPPLDPVEPEIVFVSVPTLTTSSYTSSFRKISDQHLDMAVRTVEFSRRVRCSVSVE